MPKVIMLPRCIEEKLKSDEREEVTKFINVLISDTGDEVKNEVIEIVEEKFERRLSEEVSSLKVEIANTKRELREEITNTKAELRVEIANNKAEIIKWMFIFWIGSVLTIIGGIAGLLKLANIF